MLLKADFQKNLYLFQQGRRFHIVQVLNLEEATERLKTEVDGVWEYIGSIGFEKSNEEVKSMGRAAFVNSLKLTVDTENLTPAEKRSLTKIIGKLENVSHETK